RAVVVIMIVLPVTGTGTSRVPGGRDITVGTRVRSARGRYRFARRLVDAQLEDVRPCIVTHDVEVQSRARNVAQVEFRSQDGLPLIVGAGEQIAEGPHDAAAAR